MKIIDLYGNPIEITSLEGALAQTALFKGLEHEGNPNEQQKLSDKERQLYWSDLHAKLLQLQSELNSDTLKDDLP